MTSIPETEMLGRLLATWLVLLVGCVAAEGHAGLIGSQPPDGAVIGAAPENVVLTFNEPVAPLVLRLVRSDGTVTDIKDTVVTGSELAIPLPKGLGDGGYVLSWRVASADGHPVGGSVVFQVGDAAAAPVQRKSVATGTDPPLAIAIVVIRAVTYACLFLGVGGALFAAFIARLPTEAAKAVVFALLTLPVTILVGRRAAGPRRPRPSARRHRRPGGVAGGLFNQLRDRGARRRTRGGVIAAQPWRPGAASPGIGAARYHRARPCLRRHRACRHGVAGMAHPTRCLPPFGHGGGLGRGTAAARDDPDRRRPAWSPRCLVPLLHRDPLCDGGHRRFGTSAGASCNSGPRRR